MRAPCRGSAGFILIEILISMLLLAIGFLGLAAVQSKSLVETQNTQFRSKADVLLRDIADGLADTGDLATAKALLAEAETEARHLAKHSPQLLLPVIRSLAHLRRDQEAEALAPRAASQGGWAALALGRADRDDAEGALAAIAKAGAKPPFLPDLIDALARRRSQKALPPGRFQAS